MGERRRPSSKLKISRRRIVSSGDYGDFVVSNSFRSCTNILESPCQLFRKEVKYPEPHRMLHQMNKHEQGTHILNSGAFNFLLHFLPLFFSDYNVRSFVTTSSDYGRFLSGTSLVTGALLRRSSQQFENCKIVGYKSIKGRIRISRARPIVDRLATDCSDYGFYAC